MEGNGSTHVDLRDKNQSQAAALEQNGEGPELTESLLPSSSSDPEHAHGEQQPRWLARRRARARERLMLHSESLRYPVQTIRRLGHYLAYFTLIGMLILVPSALYHALRDKNIDLAAYKSAWIMTCGTIILSVRLVYLHLTHWYMPEVQKYVVRIVWMVPLYALQSYLSLRFHQARIYIDSVRDFYEAYVIASFVYYLMELLGGQDALVEILRNKSDPNLGRHNFPLSLILEPWEPGLEFMLQCKHGVLQYVVFKTISTFLTFVFESLGVYGEGKFDWFSAYPYLCFLQNLSVMYALYCLVMLFYAVEAELRHPINWRPLGKFLCVKAVVFFCWWQGVVIFYLRAHGVIEKAGTWSSEEVANGLIDYCVVIEMVFFAIAHSYTFTYKEYLPENLARASSSASGAASAHPSNDNNNGHDQEGGGETTALAAASAAATYRPPATLPQPMKFKDAFWSSTVPKETIQDIQKLRTGLVDGSLSESTSSRHRQAGAITMQDLASSTSDGANSDEASNKENGDGPPPEQAFV